VPPAEHRAGAGSDRFRGGWRVGWAWGLGFFFF
jgi:hypothetical protein